MDDLEHDDCACAVESARRNVGLLFISPGLLDRVGQIIDEIRTSSDLGIFVKLEVDPSLGPNVVRVYGSPEIRQAIVDRLNREMGL